MQTEIASPGNSLHEWMAGAALVVLFCAFFWLGYFVGANHAPQAGSAVSASPGAPAAERLNWRKAGS